MIKYSLYSFLMLIFITACDPYKVPMVPSYQRIPVIQVEKNDTLYSLSQKYDTSVKELARRNNISNPTELKAGQKLNLPQSAKNNYVRTSTMADSVAPTVSENTPSKGTKKLNKPFVATGKVSFDWPVQGKIISTYGTHGKGVKNDGINIAARSGTAIKAAESGVVVYAGNELKGYGNLLLIRHEKDFMTAYAHASDLTVTAGEVVQKGQTIAFVGSTGNVKTPQLHFEIRQKTKPLDPKRYLQ